MPEGEASGTPRTLFRIGNGEKLAKRLTGKCKFARHKCLLQLGAARRSQGGTKLIRKYQYNERPAQAVNRII